MLDMTTLDADRCWAAVQARDPRQDGQFLMGVLTTGIYCRPSCPSRQPRRENVRFFKTSAEAEAAGLRPCKRCRPLDASPVERHRRAVEAACALIEASEETPRLADLAAAAALSPYHFHRVFSAITGVSPARYARARKLERFSDALGAGRSVTEATHEAGFGSTSRAHAAAATGLGMSPAARRRGGAGERLHYDVAQTPLGWTLLARSARGICRAAFGDAAEALVSDLRRAFPAADLVHDPEALAPLMADFVHHLASPADVLDLPLDIRGTAFQARVWEALRSIPAGTTISYAGLATALGRPSAVRAVARACAANDIAVLVPCHRVVGRSGALTGYRWGLERKGQLLAAEASVRREPSP